MSKSDEDTLVDEHCADIGTKWAEFVKRSRGTAEARAVAEMIDCNDNAMPMHEDSVSLVEHLKAKSVDVLLNLNSNTADTQLARELDICFCLDVTGSMQRWIDRAKEKVRILCPNR